MAADAGCGVALGRTGTSRPAALLAASVATLAVALPSTALAHRAKECSLAKFAVPAHITSGPDGALWYASGNEGKIGRLEIDG